MAAESPIIIFHGTNTIVKESRLCKEVIQKYHIRDFGGVGI
jgi:hypothetical protein